MRHAFPQPGGEGLWVFGYGSLMWEPGLTYLRAEAALVAGWHRRMSMVATTSYGWPGRPGLAAGLHPGGTVAGIAFLLPAAGLADQLARLSWRERHYLAVAVHARLESGARVRALAFVAHAGSGRFRPVQPRGDFLRRLAAGHGRKGATRDYVRRSAEALSASGIRMSDLHPLAARLTRAAGLKPRAGPATPRWSIATRRARSGPPR